MTVSAEYGRVHYKARKAIPRVCERCGSTERIQAALRPGTDPERLKIDEYTGSRYSLDVNDYHPLCSPCHHVVDLVEGRQACRQGHPYTPENTRQTTDGRKCRTCHRIEESARLNNPEARQAKREQDRAYRTAKPLTALQKARKVELQRARRRWRRR